ncbi:MAG: aquaporin family protein [Deltaproteobacteria bacterium]|nr:aquaporin family protein [Deltaproteobacteria bacterium]
MLASYFGEFLGTMILVVLGVGVVANVLLSKSKGENAGWMAITTGWAIAVIVAVFVAQSAGSPQADINPAVTLAKYMLGGIYSSNEVAWTILAEFTGAFVGAVIVWLAYLPHWGATSSAEKKSSVFMTSPAIRHFPSNLVAEIIGTVVLILGVGAIFGQATRGAPVPGLGPYLVGVLVWGIGLSLGGPTGYAINPARDLGPRIAHAILPIAGKGGSDWSYAWIPVLGPLLGGLIGAVLWRLLLNGA